MIKRIFDFFVASIVLLFSSIPLFVLWILVRTQLGAPVFFVQRRSGLNEKPFNLYKFRTMTQEKDANGRLLPDSARLTTFGSFLRKTSLDELPTLWNVTKGDMSLVGPRPLLIEYLDLYTQEHRKRHAVRPGITGWAQVNGRNALKWGQKFDLDVWYVENQSFLLDLRILLLTMLTVVKREGIHQEGEATMERFTGKNL